MIFSAVKQLALTCRSKNETSKTFTKPTPATTGFGNTMQYKQFALLFGFLC